jgi:hypothetical protein
VNEIGDKGMMQRHDFDDGLERRDETDRVKKLAIAGVKTRAKQDPAGEIKAKSDLIEFKRP